MRIKKEFKPSSEPVVSIYDPAIDPEKSNMVEYTKTRNLEHLVFKLGESPTKFYFRNLPSPILVNIQTTVAIEKRGLVAFGYALERIENLKDFCLTPEAEIVNDGMNIWEPENIIEIGDRKVKCCEDAEEIFHWKVVMELGFFILQRASLMRGQKPDYLALRL